jgi:hypothetical protein
MKKICLIAAVLVLLPLALSAQEFNPAGGPLEGVWENETDDEEVIIFIGNLILEKNWDSTYDVVPGMVYRNGEAYSLAESESGEPEYMFSYKLSGSTLEFTDKTDEYDEIRRFKRAGDSILRNKSPLEGSWAGSYPGDITGVFTWIFAGELLIMSLETDSYTEYSDGLEFVYSDVDKTLTAMEDSISCEVSGDVMTLGDEDDTLVLTRKR